jgi:hypothetical protein
VSGPAVALLAGLYADHDLRGYIKRQRCSPQPGMRCVEKAARSYICWLYEGYGWNRREVTRDHARALEWWLGDPWLPNQQFEYSILADGADIRNALASGSHDDLPARLWEETASALVFHAAVHTGARPHEVGPGSTETGAAVYRRLRDRRAAAQIYWYEGRSTLDDLRGACPVRTDIPAKLRCVVLAEAIVLLGRRPHVEAYIGIDDAPPGVAAEAAVVLRQFDLPRSALALLVR